MYYYIFEPALQPNGYERITQIKDLLSTLGIAGEMVTPTPGRTVEDLVDLAVAKRYSTIVAVGGSELINRVARAIEPHDTVLGIIPLQKNPDLTSLIGTSEWRSAAHQLKRRRWQPVRLGLLNNTACFLTPAQIQLANTEPYTLTTPDFVIQGKGGTISIAPGSSEKAQEQLAVRIEKPIPRSGLLSSLFGKSKSETSLTTLSVTSLELITDEKAEVVVAGSTLCTTPIHCTSQEKLLRLIVGKGTVE